MTDKQIIIDGVDVSGCRQYMPRYMEDYDIDTLDYCRYHFKPCKDVDVKYCYYKQLKRKEQECEELKKIIKEAKNSNLDLKSFLVGEAIQNEYEQQLDQLKQTLAEIKEIAEIEIECKTYEIENDCFNETRCKALKEHIDFTKQILQKISESEADNDKTKKTI